MPATKNRKPAKPLVGIVMGSQSDWETMRHAADTLDKLGIGHEVAVHSAHRTPDRLARWVKDASGKGTKVFIAGAGMAAHLPGVVASFTTRPVIGVPLASGAMQGLDALYAIVQMPPGIPVASVAVGGARNAGILAAQILATGDAELAAKLKAQRAAMAEAVAAKAKKVEKSTR